MGSKYAKDKGDPTKKKQGNTAEIKNDDNGITWDDLEQLALGEMAMTLFELNEISPRSLFNKLQGYKARMQREHEDAWQRTRLMCFYSFSPIDENDPEKKTLMPVTEFMPLPFDEVDVESSFEQLKKQAEEKRKQSAEVWAKIDN